MIWVQRKNYQPIFRHRPTRNVNLSIESLCERLELSFTRVEIDALPTFFAENSFNHILIGGAGILPKELVKHHDIINAHPGFLPNNKGLDALKWAIYNGQPIGVTTHLISAKADEGKLIERRIVPVYFEDSFHSLAYRVYEIEIEMMTHAIHLLDTGQASLESLADERYEANMRMPHHIENIMMDRFDTLRRKSNSSRG